MSPAIECPTNRPTILKNKSCIYCGVVFDEQITPTKEHVVGRRFVPRGCFDGQWNLIVQACQPCNSRKAALEDDISAITMLPNLDGKYACDDPRLAEEVRRKAAKSASRRTGKPVAQSNETFQVGGRMGAASIAFTMLAPPQIDQERIFELSCFHWTAFFYFISYDEDARLGGFLQTEFRPLISANHGDWGSIQMRWFMDLCKDWDLRALSVCADGFFRMTIRRSPHDDELWAWAVEWNKNKRVVGFSGRSEAIDDVLKDAPHRGTKIVYESGNYRSGYRKQVMLSELDDILFLDNFDGSVA